MKQSYKGIPKQHQQAVRGYIYVQASGGKRVSPANALRHLQAHWKQQREAEAAKQQEQLKQQAESFRCIAVRGAKAGLNRLAYVRDVLKAMHSGHADLDEGALIALLIPAVEVTGAEIEKAMYDLGAFGEKRPKADCGEFI